MLESVVISRRQSEIRQELSVLVGKTDPTEDETRSMETLDKEYRQNEIRYRAALVSEDEERQEAKEDLDTRSQKEYEELLENFEMRQVALALDEGRPLDGQTAEIVQELREQGGYRGVPVPWQALEQRAGETVASGTPNPVSTRPIIDRLFPKSVASRMGAQMITIDHGAVEWPVTTSSITAGWADGETSAVAGPTAYETTDRPMAPDNTLGIQVKVTRKSLKQSGTALEQAIRRDISGAMSQEIDKAIFQGTGANGQPLGVMSGAATYGITDSAIAAELDYKHVLNEIVGFMNAHTITNPGEIQLMIRPELFAWLEIKTNSDLQMSEYERIAVLLAGTKVSGSFLPNMVMGSHTLPTPTGDPLETELLMTTSTGGVSPVFVGAWGAVDMIRDVYSDAASGGLRLTALATLDQTVARPEQLRKVSGIQMTES